MGIYAAAKAAGITENLSEQAALVRKPALGGKKTIAPEMFADPATEPEYYDDSGYFEEPEPEAVTEQEVSGEPESFTEPEPEVVEMCNPEFEETQKKAEEDAESQPIFGEFNKEHGSELQDDSGTVFLQDVTVEEETKKAEPEESEPEETETPELVTQEPEPEEIKTPESVTQEPAPEEAEVIPELPAQADSVPEEESPDPFMVRVMPFGSIKTEVPTLSRKELQRKQRKQSRNGRNGRV